MIRHFVWCNVHTRIKLILFCGWNHLLPFDDSWKFWECNNQQFRALSSSKYFGFGLVTSLVIEFGSFEFQNSQIFRIWVFRVWENWPKTRRVIWLKRKICPKFSQNSSFFAKFLYLSKLGLIEFQLIEFF